MSELAVALDFPSADEALGFAGAIRGRAPWVKVGLELFTATGPEIVGRLSELGFKVFLDLKFLDIPNTVQGACRSAARSGCSLLTVHASGGAAMMKAALQGAMEGVPHTDARPRVVAVTVLTSMDGSDLAGAPGGMAAAVEGLALRAGEAGLDGVVCSPLEAADVKKAAGPGFFCVTPGIRLEAGEDDQRRTATPAEAVKAGADLLVVGRPVTRASDPAAVVLKILEQMDYGTV